MDWINGLKVRTKLYAGFLSVAVIAAIIGFFGIRSLDQVGEMAKFMNERELMGVYQVGLADANLIGAGRALRTSLLAASVEGRALQAREFEDRFAQLQKALDTLDSLFVTEAGKKMVADTAAIAARYHASGQSVLEIMRSEPLGNARQANALLMNEARHLGADAESMMLALSQRKLDDANAYGEQIEAIGNQTKLVMVILTLGGALLGLLLGWFIARVITRALGGEPAEVARIAASIASGDLTNPIDASRAPPGSVADAFSIMQESLRRVVQSVRTGSDNIASGTNQIAAGNADLSQRTEEQAASLTETASAMEELSSTVKNNAEVAQQAVQLADSASNAAVKGGEVVQSVVSTMEEINVSSRKIVEIISVIDSIAFQTNILALNAAVEAARAGEQGRGFNVVASEVRSLAQRSATAAREIKDLIDDSVGKVEAGGRQVDAAGEAMGGIVQEVKRVSDLINEISSATKEQNSGLEQINVAVGQLSDVTQQNAALVEQAASAAGSLNEQASNLVEVVGVFKVGHETPTARRVVQASSASNRATPASAPRSAPRRTGTLTTAAPARALAAAPAPKSHVLGSAAASENEWEEF